MATLKAATQARVKAGDIVTFGHYPQNADGKDKTPIEWIVLKTDGKTAMLISRYALDSCHYYPTGKDVTWETCTLRRWLNGTFLETAFSPEEQKRLQTVMVTPDKNPEYDTNPGKATQDRVFLLSIAEAKKYFSTDSERVCKPTPYAEAQGAWTDNSGTCWWWLRSPGGSSNYAANVYTDGSVYHYGLYVFTIYLAVRPVVVVGLSN